MATIAFDTHAFIKRPTAAGMPEPQAEILAEAKVDLLKWMVGALAAQTAFLSLIKFFGH